MKHTVVLLLYISLASCSSQFNNFNIRGANKLADETVRTVPVGGNTWASIKDKTTGQVSNNGIEKWTDVNQVFTTYIRFSRTGSLKVWLSAKVPVGTSEVQIGIEGKVATVRLEAAEQKDVYAGAWDINDTGYLAISIRGIKKTGTVFGDIGNLKIAGTAVNRQTAFVKDNESNFFHWGRRGPSVHLGYAVPENITVEWFYNEITVPAGNDVTGSYYMANGFAEGYFGMQVNSPLERRILFSVWSPYNTDDPKAIPEDQKIKMLKKGVGVHTGEFGNEGSGGQSYLRYHWKAGTTYGFLLQGKPDGTAHTIYTAYFFAPEKGEWTLVASFRRPKIATYLKRLHSFLENFSPEQGNVERKVLFSNQWVRDTSGNWTELDKALFTGDNTARKQYRMDYAGGSMHHAFYLRNCGFFNNYTSLNTIYERQLTGKVPVIGLELLND